MVCLQSGASGLQGDAKGEGGLEGAVEAGGNEGRDWQVKRDEEAVSDAVGVESLNGEGSAEVELTGAAQEAAEGDGSEGLDGSGGVEKEWPGTACDPAEGVEKKKGGGDKGDQSCEGGTVGGSEQHEAEPGATVAAAKAAGQVDMPIVSHTGGPVPAEALAGVAAAGDAGETSITLSMPVYDALCARLERLEVQFLAAQRDTQEAAHAVASVVSRRC